MTSRTRQSPPASQGAVSTMGRDMGATRTPSGVDFNALVSDFAAAQRTALAAARDYDTDPGDDPGPDDLDTDPHRVFGAHECTCDRDPLGVCAHCRVVLTASAWNATLANCLADADMEPKCLDCDGFPDWDGEICFACRDTRKVDAELFARGIV